MIKHVIFYLFHNKVKKWALLKKLPLGKINFILFLVELGLPLAIDWAYPRLKRVYEDPVLRQKALNIFKKTFYKRG